MEKHIQATIDYWTNLFICVFVLLITQVHSYQQVVKITLVENAVQKGAVCLDGSPAGYYYAPGSGAGSNNWIVYLPGGGWCSTEDECVLRATPGRSLGTTNNMTYTHFVGILSSNQTSNPDFYNWNRVQVKYCDGASFMADVEAVYRAKINLHLRGARIFRTVMDELLAKGMKNANNAILVGNSAGGLAAMLHCDGFRTLVPNAGRVKCISDSGFFIRGKDLPGVEERDKLFANVVEFHELAKSLPTSCTSRMDPSLCLFPENLIGDIQTPLFVLNSDFDQYQLQANFKPQPADQAGWYECAHKDPNIYLKGCTPAQLQTMKDFRTAFLQTLGSIGYSPSTGIFINSCFIHDFLYRNNYNGVPTLGDKTTAKAIGDWYFERSSVKEIDTQTDSPMDCLRHENISMCNE